MLTGHAARHLPPGAREASVLLLCLWVAHDDYALTASDREMGSRAQSDRAIHCVQTSARSCTQQVCRRPSAVVEVAHSVRFNC